MHMKTYKDVCPSIPQSQPKKCVVWESGCGISAEVQQSALSRGCVQKRFDLSRSLKHCAVLRAAVLSVGDKMHKASC